MSNYPHFKPTEELHKELNTIRSAHHVKYNMTEKPKSPICKLWYLVGQREGYEQGKLEAFKELENIAIYENLQGHEAFIIRRDVWARLKSQIKEKEE